MLPPTAGTWGWVEIIRNNQSRGPLLLFFEAMSAQRLMRNRVLKTMNAVSCSHCLCFFHSTGSMLLAFLSTQTKCDFIASVHWLNSHNTAGEPHKQTAIQDHKCAERSARGG